MRPVILMYHRIARAAHDPWSVCVDPELFAEQLAWLKSARRVLSMADFARQHAEETLPGDAVAITFDDGYVDNLDTARPVLADLNLTATLFVVSGAVGMSGGFWWDELADLVLMGSAIDCSVDIVGRNVILQWDERRSRPGWIAADPAPGPREAAFLALWRSLQRAPEDDRQHAMKILRAHVPRSDHTVPRVLDRAGLAALTAEGIFSLGGHSITHPALTTLSDEDVRREIVESSAACQSAQDTGQVGFAYPYGDLDERVWRLAATTDIAWACTTRPAAVTPGTDRFSLPRLAVGNWGVAEFSAALNGVR